MARAIVVRLEGEESTFAFTKIEREKLYGKKQRVVVDDQGRDCAAAWLTADGTALVPTGGTAHVWVDEKWNACEQDCRVAIDHEGNALVVKPSTLGVAQDAHIVPVQRVLDHVIAGVYQLSADVIGPNIEAALNGGSIIEIPFRYKDGLDEDAMFLLSNDEGYFALLARHAGFAMLEREQLPLSIDAADENDDKLAGDLDFSMML